MPAPPPRALSDLPSGRRGILIALRKLGEAAIGELAGVLRISPSAVRQQLGPLEAAGLIEHRRVPGAVGRPRHLYRLAAEAEPLFPKSYGGLAAEILDHVASEDPELLERAFARRAAGRTERALARLAGRPFGERVAELARILDEDGYLADFARAPDGSYRIVEHNCAILEVARRHAGACTSELAFLRDAMPDAEIERVAHMMAGAHVCAYAIRERAPAGP